MDEPPTEQEGDRSYSSTSLLEIPEKLPDISKKYPSNGGESCPLIFTSCPQHNLDADCLGNSKKRIGCHIFIEKGITSPPKGIDCNDYVLNVLKELQRKKQHYERLEQNCINQKENLEKIRQNYEQALNDLSTFKKEYFI